MPKHPVLDLIDINKPYFDRAVEWVLPGENRVINIQLWLPVQLENSCWVCPVLVTGLTPEMGAMPGDDPLGALIKAIAFVRHLLESQEGKFLFNGYEMARLPLFLDRGFSAEKVSELERKANELSLEERKRVAGTLFDNNDV